MHGGGDRSEGKGRSVSSSRKRPRPDGIRLYCMCGGTLAFDQSVFTYMRGMGTTVRVPTPVFLIDHPAGKVLFETGVHPSVAENAELAWGERARSWSPSVRSQDIADQLLARLDVQPEDIRYVVLSCLLPDHAGGMQLFPKATFIVQFRELQDAWWPDRRLIRSYEFNELLPTRGFDFLQLYDQDLDLFGDGTVEVLFCPAHTRGEQALVVRLPNTGTVVLPAGVLPQKANLDHWIMTGTPRVDPVAVYASMYRLREIIRRESATVIFHHDAKEWEGVRKIPAYYD